MRTLLVAGVALLMAGTAASVVVRTPADVVPWGGRPVGWDREFLYLDRAASLGRENGPAVAVPPGHTAWADLMGVGGRPEPGQTWRLDGRPVTFTGPVRASASPRTAPAAWVVGSPDPAPPYRTARTRPGYRPPFPITVKPVPGRPQMLAITESGPYEAASLVRFPDRPDVTAADAVALHRFPGVAYDLAFHPKFAENGFLFVGWNGKGDGSHFTRVTRFTLDPTTLDLDPASAKLVIEWDSNGHNGGALAFGSDGTLFVTSGDGTADSDVDRMGQRPGHLRAKVLRIDVDRPAPGNGYSVPADNPFVADPRFRPETWAYGLRNPWRMGFDPASGQLWVGNNGQDQFEQAYLIQKGANYGWSLVEGSGRFHPEQAAGPHPVSPPTVEHSHAEARSLTGGVVYRGTKFPELVGAYVYGDYSTGRIWAVKHDGTKVVWQRELARTRLKLTAVTLDRDGELLLCDHQPAGQGGFHTLEPSPVPATLPPHFPTKLSATGLFTDLPTHALRPELVPYEVNAPFWSDGLQKVRAFGLPAGGTVGYKRAGGWEFPDGSVIVKSFRTPAAWVETRLMVKADGEWAGYSYRWNEAGTDAELVPAAGADRDLGGQVWRYPGRAECMVCHTRAANYVLGLCEVQANRGDQLARWEAAGLFAVDWVEAVKEGLTQQARDAGKADLEIEGWIGTQGPPAGTRPDGPSALLPKAPERLDRLADPFDPTHPVEVRARSWLHSNCSSCHVSAGGGNARMELGFRTPRHQMNAVGEKPLHAHPGGRLLVAPGDPDGSVLLKRVASCGADRMPPVGRNVTDDRAVSLLREWIAGLPR
jgi:glucose/arabinose dehydrogenase/mono/diheme cytochrome c family protein